GTGFYTTPWLNFIDQDAAAIGKQFPMHGAQTPEASDTEVSAPANAPSLPPESNTGIKDDQHD
ncbi:MAG: NADH:quinone oxidoreductase, partial [Methylobacter sp.]